MMKSSRSYAARFLLIAGLFALPIVAWTQQLPLRALVTPSTVISKDDHVVTFALRGFLEFQSLSESFQYIDSQVSSWRSKGLSEDQVRNLQRELVRRAVESRVVSMMDERPLESLVTHTAEELRRALAEIHQPTPDGYSEAFLAVQEKWKHSLNCWSASPSIPGRVLSNWYPIEEGIQLYGATYDSTEHFWQAVKYHPETTVRDLQSLLEKFRQQDWRVWLGRMDNDPKVYLPNAYAIEFLRHNLTAERLQWFSEELVRQNVRPDDHARAVQQRGSVPLRFTAFEEKVLWGDLADIFQLVYVFSPADDPVRDTLARAHFDGIYLGNRKMGFISEEFRSLMLEIWKVKYLQMPRFREVITSIPMEIRLEHFLNDGDSPDIPIPIYVGYLNQIRQMARAEEKH